jgi:AraC-like DNA-binding protein
MSDYAERAAPAWIAGPVACLWSTVATGQGTVLPDACVDLIHVEGLGTFVAGPDTRPVSGGEDPAVGAVAGVRLRPGHAAAALGIPAEELRDRRVWLDELWGRAGAELSRRIGDARTTAERHALMAAALARRESQPDPLALAAIALLARDPGRRVAEIAAELAVSERHLLRRVRGAVGYGPKTLARVLRFQRLLALAQTSGGSLADLALEAGYADQPHMTGEVTRLAGASPTEVLGIAHARGDPELVRSLQDDEARAA